MSKKYSNNYKQILLFNNRINSIKDAYTDVDLNYQKYFINWLISYIHNNNQKNTEDLINTIISIPSDFVKSISLPNINEFYLYRTQQLLLKDKKLLETHIESFLKKERNLEPSEEEYYTVDMSDNIQKYIKNTLSNYFMSDTFCTTPELTVLKEKYFNGDSDNLFIKKLSNFLYECTNADFNQYYVKFFKKMQNNHELLCNTLIKKQNVIFSLSDDENDMESQTLTINNFAKSMIYSDNDLQNAEILLQTEILPNLPSNVLVQLYGVLKENPEKAKFIFSSLVDIMFDKVDKEEYKHFSSYKYNLEIRIKRIVEFLDNLNLMDIYNNTNNSRLDKLGISELQFSKDELINNLTDLSKLSSYSLETLLGLSSFYTNRAVKSVSELCKAIYVLKKLDLFDEIINNENFGINDINCTDDELKELLAQYDLISYDIKTNVLDKMPENKKIDIQAFSKSYDKVLKKIEVGYENRYPGCSKEDFNFITSEIDSVEDCLYVLKHQTLVALIYTAIKDNKKNIINWGYINEFENKKDDKILLGFDIQALNMPIKLHLKKKELEQFIEEASNNSIIPCYIGNEDTSTSAGHLSTQVLTVVPKDKKKAILKNDKTHSLFFNHIKWMQKPLEKPEYIKNLKERYYDLITEHVFDAEQVK